MYKIVLFAQVYNELEKGNLERFIKYTKPLVDDMVFYDDASTDGSYEFLLKHTPHVIRGTINDFKAEQNHKQILLEKALSLNPDFILWLDADEILTANVTRTILEQLCQHLINNNADGMQFHINNIWRSNTYKRLDDSFNNLHQCKLWRNTVSISFLPTAETNRLHLSGHPPTLQNIIFPPLPFIESMHYGFSSEYKIANKYFTYKNNGQSGWELDRLIREDTLQLEKIPKEMIYPELYIENELMPTPNTPFDICVKHYNNVYGKSITKPEVSIVCLIYKSVDWLKFIWEQVNKYTNLTNKEFFFVANDANEEVLYYLQTNNIPHYIFKNTEEQKKQWYIQNVYRAWNYACYKSKGEYLLFINSDMGLSPCWFENLFTKLNPNNCVASRLIESGKLPSGQYGVSCNLGQTIPEYQEKNFISMAEQISSDELKDGGLFMPLLIRKIDFVNANGYPEGNILQGSDLSTPIIANESEAGICISGDVVLMQKLEQIGIKHQTAFNSIVYHFQQGEMDD